MVDIIFFIGEFFLISSYLFSNLLYLRIGAAIGMACYAIGALVAGFGSSGMKSVFIFSIITVIINVAGCVRIILKNKPIKLTEEMKVIYDSIFNMLTTKEFYEIYTIGTKRTFITGENLTLEGTSSKYIFLITKGSVEVLKQRQVVKRLESGYFIGEVSFLTENVSNATVQATKGEVEVIQWDKQLLDNLEKKNDDLYSKFNYAIVFNLIKKLE